MNRNCHMCRSAIILLCYTLVLQKVNYYSDSSIKLLTSSRCTKSARTNKNLRIIFNPKKWYRLQSLEHLQTTCIQEWHRSALPDRYVLINTRSWREVEDATPGFYLQSKDAPLMHNIRHILMNHQIHLLQVNLQERCQHEHGNDHLHSKRMVFCSSLTPWKQGHAVHTKEKHVIYYQLIKRNGT
jgi:hypothetical protein